MAQFALPHLSSNLLGRAMDAAVLYIWVTHRCNSCYFNCPLPMYTPVLSVFSNILCYLAELLQQNTHLNGSWNNSRSDFVKTLRGHIYGLISTDGRTDRCKSMFLKVFGFTISLLYKYTALTFTGILEPITCTRILKLLRKTFLNELLIQMDLFPHFISYNFKTLHCKTVTINTLKSTF